MSRRINKRISFFVNITLVLIIAFIFGLIGYSLLKNDSFVPESFVEARSTSSFIASELVSILDNSSKILDKILEEDKNGKFSSALELVDQEIEKIESANNKALELSKELIKMAESLREIKPFKARDLAFTAITQETSLLFSVRDYNSFFSSLLETLRLKFTDDVRYNDDNIQTLMKKMNEGAKEINSINESFNQELKAFDKAL